MARSEGFTLIELLIVVAIIAILAAIAVPNFLEAQTRSKVSRLISDMRTLVTALEAYRVDHNRYINPYWPSDPQPEVAHMAHVFLKMDAAGIGGFTPQRWKLDHQNVGRQLTTPISYMTMIPTDTFWTGLLLGLTPDDTATYGEWAQMDVRAASPMYTGAIRNQPLWAFNRPPTPVFKLDFCLHSVGPDLVVNQGSSRRSHVYDPTNGTVSDGDIFYFGPYGFTGGISGYWNVGQPGS